MTMRLVPLAVALLATSLAAGMDLTLSDGRVLHDAHFVRQDAATVTFRHAGGFAQLEKQKLPPELRAQFPLDEAQARIDADRHAAEVKARVEENKRLLAERAAIAAANPAPVEPPYVPPEPLRPTVSPDDRDGDYYPLRWTHNRNYGYRDNRYGYDRDRRRHHDYAVTPAPPPPPFNANIGMTADIHSTIGNTTPTPTPPTAATEEEQVPPFPRPYRSR